jgi:ferredoxin-NADP reductase
MVSCQIFLCDLKPGEEISCQGPFGGFILRPPMRDSIFIATGSGIAPFRPMLHWLLSDPPQHQGKELWRVFGNRTEGDLYYHHEFIRLAAERPNFHYLPTLSRGGPRWTGLRGYVQDPVPAIVQGRPGMQAYISGLEKMVRGNRELLKSLGWDRKSIHYEKYDRAAGCTIAGAREGSLVSSRPIPSLLAANPIREVRHEVLSLVGAAGACPVVRPEPV